MLTHQQNRLLGYIRSEVAETGLPPTFEAMATAMRLKSKSGVHRMVGSLIERGYLEKAQGVSRGIRIVKLPRLAGPSTSLTEALGPGHDIAPTSPPPRPANDDVTSVPLMGDLASTVPASEFGAVAGEVEVPADVVSNREHFACRVRGDAMRDAGIVDGDVAVFRVQDDARAGDVVVAVIDGREAVMGRYHRDGRARVFETGGPGAPSRRFRDHRVEVRGKLVTVLRRY